MTVEREKRERKVIEVNMGGNMDASSSGKKKDTNYGKVGTNVTKALINGDKK